jgi:hypothetical protein
MRKAIILTFLLISTLSNCQQSGQKSSSLTGPAGTEAPSAEAIRIIMAADEKLGDIRNHACEDTTLAETVRRYVAGLAALDFSRCPEDFTAAFRAHRDAWEATISFFDQFGELRGEMHELLETIEQGEKAPALQSYIRPVWDTWGKVDSIARKYGALHEE